MKHTGLSHLADVAREMMQPGLDHHYPVKEKGGRRKLNPNWTAIDWLESDETSFQWLTEIVETEPLGLLGDLLDRQLTPGSDGRSYARPVFEVITDAAFSGNRIQVTPCEACDNYAYTWKCDTHPELEWDTESRRWNRPHGAVSPCRCALCRADSFTQARRERFFDESALLQFFQRRRLHGHWQTDNFTLEVNGETVQGISGFTINIEGDGGAF